ncbi:Predicted heterodisulfide reductase/ glutamate synthase fusion protein HdrL [Desulfamplus magnetovallimortis]|uniref:Predicted heterodisulfide reductase/ glutamate synthase fusion protein HdrL n=1 Tax=Desulfamplus magnetovallimortis TaxID=1246637 RepID=A0A1W1H5A7_9BACT|nr:Predicted heterodisulfide reductase/ glutamate synthase fusion protein HdrL [Desulfamplus magnetovallimortis]
MDFPSEHNQGLAMRKAIFKQYEQAIPGAFGISKRSTAPCKATCPAHVSIQGFIALMNQGKYREALKLFKEEHPFPGACGRVCHHPCEAKCTRGDVEEPLAIQHLHRFLSDTDFASDEPYVPEIAEKRDEKVAIVGSGPAGLTAAYYMARKGYGVTVFEKLPVKGGMMAVGIPEYRLPHDELMREIEVIEKLGVEIKTNVEFGKDVTLDSLKSDGYSTLFMATGLHGSRGLGIEGENLDGILKGVNFLRESAINNCEKNNNNCEALLGKVVVIGGGNVAVDVALTARRLGSKDVTMACLEDRIEMPAWDYEVEEALEEKVTIRNSLGPARFIEKDGAVCGVEFKRCTAVFDEQGRFNPQYDETDLTTIEADYVIVAIGQMAELEFAKSQDISVTPRGGLEADPVTLQTPIPWVFAGGDVFYGPKSVVDAIACGKEAAESMHRFIHGEDLAADREKSFEFEKPDISNEAKRARVHPAKVCVEEREGNFCEVTCGLSEEDIRRESDRCLSCGICSECYQCVDACLAGAIDHCQQVEYKELPVGSVIMASGSRPFDPSGLGDIYLYKRSPNVMTSLEFERILSAGGPTMGHLERPSDGKEPEKIAWLQCIGSRDSNKCGNGYCSSVCCMYAVKDAMIAKEHSHHELDCVIFNMDMRTFGKDYEKYYIRARDEEKVRFVKSRIHSVDEVRETGNLMLTYVDEAGNICKEEFDMVILSVGLTITEENRQLAATIGVELDKYGFAKTSPFNPLESSRPGVFVSGVFQGPKDIPSSVTEASGAACAAGVRLIEARNSCTKSVEVVEERDISDEEPRVGVFVCKCGINIAGIVDVDAVSKYAETLPDVVYVGENLFTCSQDAQDNMKNIIVENRLNRVVVASCTPKTHEGIFMDTLEKSGLNKYLFEMANIRNQNSWMHFHEPEKATKKAKDLVRMAVARAATLHPLHEKRISVTVRALVIGGGIAGMTAAKGLADQGFDVVLVEKEARLGGLGNQLYTTIEGANIREFVKKLASEVEAHEKIQVLKQSLIVDFTGYKGNFTTEVLVGPGMYERKIEHGVMIIATGANEYSPEEYLYKESDRVVTQLELGHRLEEQGADDLEQVVMIQCVGSRNEKNVNCSRVCCQGAVKNALHIKELNPDADVFILYRDMRMYAMLEDYYTEARNKGVLFFRYDPEDPPVVEKNVEKAEDGSLKESLTVTFTDHVIGRKLAVDADLVTLSAGVEAADTEELATILKTNRNQEGFFIEAHVKLRPVDAATEGIFICGTAHGPKLITETIAQAMAAASRATTFLSQDELTLSAVTAEVNPENCASCLICVRSCPYGVPIINEDGVSYIDAALCHGCGVCASECPAKTIKLNWYEDNQLLSKVESLLEGVI